MPFLKKDDTILDVGSGSCWVEKSLRHRGYSNVMSLDLEPPAGVIGDIRTWRSLGLRENSFDAIIICETLEHVDCMKDLQALLKQNGRLLVTTPVPRGDWVLKILESLKLTQPRVSPHAYLQDIRSFDGFRTFAYRRVFGLSQWGAYEKL